MAKDLLFGGDAREKLFKGITTLSEAVTATLGPKGRNAVLAKTYGPPVVTKDGVTVAKEIELEDPFENVGAQLVKEAATKTNDLAGDGTTTATVLAYAMMKECKKHLGAEANPILIKKGMELAVKTVCAHLETIKKDVTQKSEYEAVATISSQDAEIGTLVAEVIDQVGKEGVVTVEPGKTLGLEKEFVDGMQFDNGYISQYFVTDPTRMEAVYEDIEILVTDQKIGSAQELLPILEPMLKSGRKKLLIIAENVEGDALPALIVNKLQGNLSVVAVKAPAFGDRRKEILKDIAALTGATFVSQDVGLKLSDCTPVVLGRARRVVVSKDSTTIVDGKGDTKDVEARIAEIKASIETTKSDFDKEKLRERLAKLTGGIAVVKVGAATEVEQKEKQHRVEDALAATKAAAEEGIVAGGGVAYINCIPSARELLEKTTNEDEKVGIKIVMHAMKIPTWTIAENAGVSGEVVVAETIKLQPNEGFNALTGKYTDLIKDMVIDPKKVTRLALENACSVASMFLTLEVAIVDLPKPTPSPEGAQMGM